MSTALRQLLRDAEHAGLDRTLLRRAGDELAELLACVDERKLDALRLAQRVTHLQEQGLSQRAVAARLGISKTRVVRVLDQFGDMVAP